MGSEMSDKELRELLADYERQINDLQAKANALVAGRRVLITGDWNGQPHGSSRPSRKGKIFTAHTIYLNGFWSGLSIQEYPYDCGPYLRDVEFQEAAPR